MTKTKHVSVTINLAMIKKKLVAKPAVIEIFQLLSLQQQKKIGHCTKKNYR